MFHIRNLNSIKLKCEDKWTETLNVILNWKGNVSFAFHYNKISRLQWF